MRHVRGPVTLVVALALAACSKQSASAEKEKSPAVVVHCVALTSEGVDESVSLRGHLEPPPGGDLSVASQVMGRIVSVQVKEGQPIAAGDVVAIIDDASSRGALIQAEAAVAQARAADINAAAALARTKELVRRGIAPKQEQEDAIARADGAHAAVNAAQAALDLARRTLARVTVRSSFVGTVTKVLRGPGALVDGTAATPVVQVATSSGVDFVADATQRELAAIQEGQSVKGELVQGGEIEGVVRSRSTALDPQTGLGIVRITLAPTAMRPPAGSFGRVVITTGHRDNVLVLPSAALRGGVADGAEVAVCKDEKIEIKTVKVGFRDNARIEVLDGLTTTDHVAIDHVLGLDNGTVIKEAETKPPGDE